MLIKRTFLTDFRKILKYKFPWKPSSGNQVVPRKRTDRQTAMTKLTFTFLQLFDAPKNQLKVPAVKYKVK
jgi:hypothetical protein